MILEKFPGVQRLSASERLLFVSELWNDLEAHPSALPVAPEILSALDQRMEHFRQHPDEFTTWEAVKERVLGRRLLRPACPDFCQSPGMAEPARNYPK